MPRSPVSPDRYKVKKTLLHEVALIKTFRNKIIIIFILFISFHLTATEKMSIYAGTSFITLNNSFQPNPIPTKYKINNPGSVLGLIIPIPTKKIGIYYKAQISWHSASFIEDSVPDTSQYYEIWTDDLYDNYYRFSNEIIIGSKLSQKKRLINPYLGFGIGGENFWEDYGYDENFREVLFVDLILIIKPYFKKINLGLMINYFIEYRTSNIHMLFTTLTLDL